ncbi:MAG TPA: ABC transporter ATP-binding protein [Planctomycetota bacterium]|nr:ABC transporter ATP-binding protein [Planctomycetota bacterium]
MSRTQPEPKSADAPLEIRTENRLVFYLSLGRRYRRRIIGMMALVGVYSVMTAARLSAIGLLEILRVRFQGEGGRFLQQLESARRWLFGPGGEPLAKLLHESDAFFYKFLLGTLGAFTLLAILMAVSFYFKELFAQSLILDMEVDIRRSLFRHLTRQSVAYFNRQRSGDVISRLTNDINAVRQSFKLFFEDVVQQPVIIVCTLAAGLWASPLLFMICVPFYGVLMLPVLRSGRKIIKHGKGRLEKLSLLTEAIGQLFSGIRIVKAFGMERHEENEFAARNKDFIRSTLKMNRAKIKARAVQELLYNLGTAIAILAGVALIATGRVAPEPFMVFLAAMVQVYMPFKGLSTAWNQLQESRSAVERILEVLRERPQIRDLDGSFEFPGLAQEIRFDSVSFSYSELDPALASPAGGNGAGTSTPLRLPVLHDVSFRVEKGEIVALVGPSGAGKSTIADLIARFYDPQRGSVAVDGRDIREFRFASYLRAVAIVSQDPFLFHTTIRNNIRYGRESASDEEVEAAARVAFAHDFILEQSGGYETVIGERGVKLSGGQRQRLTIARAVLKNAPILILDEATSSLDSQSEMEVQKAIDNLIRDRTTFVIAHRLSTIVHADRILVVDEGRIVESGRHEDLLRARGRYWELWRSQNREA